MGKPSKGTPADRRLKENAPRAKPTGPRPMPAQAQAKGRASAPGQAKRSAAVPGVPPSMPQVLKSPDAPKVVARTKAADQAPRPGPATDMAFTLRAMPRKGG